MHRDGDLARQAAVGKHSSCPWLAEEEEPSAIDKVRTPDMGKLGNVSHPLTPEDLLIVHRSLAWIALIG